MIVKNSGYTAVSGHRGDRRVRLADVLWYQSGRIHRLIARAFNVSVC
jgi:hypothetical protein